MILRTVLCVLLATSICIADEQAVMRIQASRQVANAIITSHGTCVAFDGEEFNLAQKRSILTAAHVVCDDGQVVKVEVSEGKWVTCKVVRLDKVKDLALLSASEDLPSRVQLEASVNLRVAGSPMGKPVTAQAARLLCSEAAFAMAHGMSGGAVFNKEGKLHGIIIAGTADDTGKLRGDAGVFVSIEQVRTFLKGK